MCVQSHRVLTLPCRNANIVKALKRPSALGGATVSRPDRPSTRGSKAYTLYIVTRTVKLFGCDRAFYYWSLEDDQSRIVRRQHSDLINPRPGNAMTEFYPSVIMALSYIEFGSELRVACKAEYVRHELARSTENRRKEQYRKTDGSPLRDAEDLREIDRLEFNRGSKVTSSPLSAADNCKLDQHKRLLDALADGVGREPEDDY